MQAVVRAEFASPRTCQSAGAASAAKSPPRERRWPDLFLSYAHEDGDAAQGLAAAHGELGHKVWWDRDLHGGTRFASEIDRQLEEADAVIVLWSRHSCESPWVQDEASEGRDSGRMVPAGLDGSRPPLGFRQYQSVDFSGFPADRERGWRRSRGRWRH